MSNESQQDRKQPSGVIICGDVVKKSFFPASEKQTEPSYSITVSYYGGTQRIKVSPERYALYKEGSYVTVPVSQRVYEKSITNTAI